VSHSFAEQFFVGLDARFHFANDDGVVDAARALMSSSWVDPHLRVRARSGVAVGCAERRKYSYMGVVFAIGGVLRHTHFARGLIAPGRGLLAYRTVAITVAKPVDIDGNNGRIETEAVGKLLIMDAGGSGGR
jgi:hypothetical protein